MGILSRQEKIAKTSEAITKFCGKDATIGAIAANFTSIWSHVFDVAIEESSQLARLAAVTKTTNKAIKAPFGNIRTITADEAYLVQNFQRPLDIERALRYALDFKIQDVEAATYILFNGKKCVVDKQHCFLAACLVGATEFPTKFTSNVTKIGEYFVELQENRASVSAASKFKAKCNDGVEPHVSIQRLAHKYGFHVDTEEYGSKFAQYTLIKPVGAILWLFDNRVTNGGDEENLWVWEMYLSFIRDLRAKKPDYVQPKVDSYSADKIMKSMMRFIGEKYTDENPLDLDGFVDYIVTNNRAPHDFAIDLEKEKTKAKVQERGAAGTRVIIQWYNKATGKNIKYADIGKRRKAA